MEMAQALDPTMNETCLFCSAKQPQSDGECGCVIGRQFVKTINMHSGKSLRLPLRFATYAQEASMTKCILIGPLKHKWEVKLIKDDEGCSLGAGWDSFHKDHNLAPGCTLTFKYIGNSSFKVTVFDAVSGESVHERFASKVKKEVEPQLYPDDLGNGVDRTGNRDTSEAPRKLGRPRNPRPDWKDERMIKLKGVYLSSMNVFRLKQELSRRGLSDKGYKADLVDRLGDYLLKKRSAAHVS